MAVSATCTAVIKNADGSIHIQFSDGSGYQFATLDDLQNFGRQFDERGVSEMAYVLLIRWWLARSSNASNTGLITGKKLTFDLSAASPIKVQ